MVALGYLVTYLGLISGLLDGCPAPWAVEVVRTLENSVVSAVLSCAQHQAHQELAVLVPLQSPLRFLQLLLADFTEHMWFTLLFVTRPSDLPDRLFSGVRLIV
jgi:hypothetical protein